MESETIEVNITGKKPGGPAANPKKRGLGRGLDALFEDGETAAPQGARSAGEGGGTESAGTDGRGRNLIADIDQIIPNPNQPRNKFDPVTLNELAASIRKHGVLQPLLVRRDPNGTRVFEIIAGERRWRAAQQIGLHKIPVVVAEMDDGQALETALVENLQREDLYPLDEAAGYKRLIEEYGRTQEEAAELVGKSRAHVSNMIRLLDLPVKVRVYLARGALSAGHARALLKADNPLMVAEEVLFHGLSVRETENLVARSQGRTQEARPRRTKAKDADTAALEKDVSNALGMRVSIDSRDGQNGKLTVQFKSLDQLDELVKRLSR